MPLTAAIPAYVRAPCIMFVALAVGCGGRESSAGAGLHDGGPSVDDALAIGDGVSTACSAGGVRVCGAGCPWLDSMDCPGAGCTAVSTVDGGASDVGVCWSDVPDNGTLLCTVCNDGEACVQRAPGQLVCVPADVCARLWALGATDVCRYADKATYDNRPLPQPSGCPPGATTIVCGGSCPACPASYEHRCVGRSPDHPFGYCPDVAGLGDPNDPSAVAPCALDGSHYVVACPPLPQPSTDVYACAVFHASASDEAVSRLFGTCMGMTLCRETASVLPGGLDCFDPNGLPR